MLMAVNNIPMMNADIVTGVGLCLLFVVLFNGWGAFAGWVNSWQTLVVLPERLTMGFGTLLLAHICFNIPYVILAVGPKLRQMDRNLIDAAQDLGCTWMQAFWRVVIPGDQARHRLRRAHGLHDVDRRLHHQLLYRRHQFLDAGDDDLRHDEKARQPGDQRHLDAAVRDGARAARAHQRAREPRR